MNAVSRSFAEFTEISELLQIEHFSFQLTEKFSAAESSRQFPRETSIVSPLNHSVAYATLNADNGILGPDFYLCIVGNAFSVGFPSTELSIQNVRRCFPHVTLV